MSFVLRPYQQEAVDCALRCLEGRKNGILVLPTGSGKSLVIASIAKLAGGRTLVLQPSKEILEQNKAKMEAMGEIRIGVYSASCGRKDIGRITFATIGSIIKQKELFQNFDRIIIDEAHGVNAKGGMYEELISKLGIQTLGLTATPYRLRVTSDGSFGNEIVSSVILTRTRPRIFNEIIHVTQIKDLFSQGYLCKLDYDCANSYDSNKVKRAGMGFNDRALFAYNKSQSVTDKVVEAVAKSNANHCLVFTQLRQESKYVIGELAKKGVYAAEVSGETPKSERENILYYFTTGRLKCVVNVGVLTTGFDFPKLDCIIIGRPTRSVALYYQMTGRGIRIAPGKESCKLIDLCDNVKRFGSIETFEMVDPSNGNGMWRLKSDKGYLTGVNILTGYDLERNNSEIKTPIDPARHDVVPFGKFRGVPLELVPTHYLQWASENFEDGNTWKQTFKNELSKRLG